MGNHLILYTPIENYRNMKWVIYYVLTVASHWPSEEKAACSTVMRTNGSFIRDT